MACHSSAQRASAAYTMALLSSVPALAPSSLALPTGGGKDRKYNDGDLTGKGVRVYIVDGGVLGSHDEFGGRVVNGHTVRVVAVAACTRPLPTARATRPPAITRAPAHPSPPPLPTIASFRLLNPFRSSCPPRRPVLIPSVGGRGAVRAMLSTAFSPLTVLTAVDTAPTWPRPSVAETSASPKK